MCFCLIFLRTSQFPVETEVIFVFVWVNTFDLQWWDQKKVHKLSHSVHVRDFCGVFFLDSEGSFCLNRTETGWFFLEVF